MKNAIFFHMAKHSVRCPKRPATRCQTGTQNPLPIYPFLLFPTEVWLYAGAVGVSVVVVLLLGAVMHNKIRIYIRAHAFALSLLLDSFSLRILIKHEKWRVQLPKMIMHTGPSCLTDKQTLFPFSADSPWWASRRSTLIHKKHRIAKLKWNYLFFVANFMP